MIDYDKELVSALSKVLPVHYELTLTSGTKTPCISYQERNNFSSALGDTQEYSVLTYTIKVWSQDIEEVQKYALKVDSEMRKLGFKRESVTELLNKETAMIQKIMAYSANAHEKF